MAEGWARDSREDMADETKEVDLVLAPFDWNRRGEVGKKRKMNEADGGKGGTRRRSRRGIVQTANRMTADELGRSSMSAMELHLSSTPAERGELQHLENGVCALSRTSTVCVQKGSGCVTLTFATPSDVSGGRRRRGMGLSPFVEWAAELCETNVGEMYEKVWGWDDDSKREELNSTDARFLIARVAGGEEEGGEPPPTKVAFAHFRFESYEKVPAMYVYDVQIEANYRRQGLGQEMMNMLEGVARTLEMSKIVLTVFKANKGAVRFYERRGFVVDETCPTKFGIETCGYLILSYSIG